MDTVLIDYITNSFILILGVGALTILFGVSTAWVITMVEFPGRAVFEWLLLLPLAIPAYLMAYIYTDFFPNGIKFN